MASNAEFKPSAICESFVAASPDVIAPEVTAFQAHDVDCDLKPSAGGLDLTSSTKYDF